MGIFVEWFGANWFNLLQTVAIVAGLFFTGRSFLVDTRIRRISNLLNITEHHRSIWQQVIDKPNLLRVLNAEAKLDIKPITLEERIFVNLIILHLTAVMAAIRGRVHEQPAGLHGRRVEPEEVGGRHRRHGRPGRADQGRRDELRCRDRVARHEIGRAHV